MGKNAPEPPSPKETAAAATGTNATTAVANSYLSNVTQRTPYGSLEYKQTGTKQVTDPYSGAVIDVPQWEAVQTNSPEVDALQKRLLASADQAPIQTPTYERYANAPQLQTTYNGDFSEDRKRVEDAILGRLKPQFEADRKGLEAKLANQGLMAGSDGWNREIDAFNRGQNDARIGAILSGGQEQSRLVGLERDRAAFGNAALQANADNAYRTTTGNNAIAGQSFADANASRSEQTNAFLRALGIMQPGYVSASQNSIPTTDVAGLIQQDYSNRFGQFQQQQQFTSNILGGLLGLGGSILAASDRRIKHDIKRVGTLDNGLPIYVFKYIGSEQAHIGVMAQEAQEARPDAVIDVGGRLYVDYEKAVA